MKIFENKIYFDKSDTGFIKKFGLMECAKMVADFRALNDLPFIYDTDQLVAFLGVDKLDFFKMLRSDCKKCYYSFTIKKRNGGERILNSPTYSLKHCQYRILREILDKFTVSKYATAYKSGARLKDNASVHTGKKYLLKMDITDFFGSITFHQVYKSAFNTKYFPKHIGVMLTKLCCLDEVLPQGASTSPALSNIVLKNFDNNIGIWCEKHGISYTRYCDDLTFSSNKPLNVVYHKVKKLLEESGFEINDKKTHFVTNASRQSVTGLTVNEKVSVCSDYKRRLRQEVFYALKYGFYDALKRSGNTEITTAEQYRNHLEGMINYVLQIEPDNKWFKEKLCEINNLPW